MCVKTTFIILEKCVKTTFIIIEKCEKNTDKNLEKHAETIFIIMENV
jgi:hypothetical protein